MLSIMYSGTLAQGARRIAGVLRRGGGPSMNEATHEERHVARRDAGWMQVLGTDLHTARGRGQLRMWGEQQQPGASTIDARLESFTPAGEPLQPGEDVMLFSERAMEHYPVRIRSCEPGDVVVLDWPVDDIPATLRETGGN